MRRLSLNTWILVYFAYFILVNIFSEAGYTALLISEILLGRNTSLLNGKNVSLGRLAFFAMLPLLLQPYPYINSIRALILSSIIFSMISALAEEYFFRGVILPIAGNPIQAYLFALTHLNITNPVYLVNTSLLVPHYFLIGLILGKTAENHGLFYSIIFHVGYNIVSQLFYLNFTLQAVLYLLIAEAVLCIFMFVKR